MKQPLGKGRSRALVLGSVLAGATALSHAQVTTTHNANNLPIEITPAAAATYEVNIPVSIPANVTGKVTLEVGGFPTCGVGSGISHTWLSDLVLTLVSPDGTQVKLLDQDFGDDIDLCGVIFDDDAPNGTYAGAAPSAAVPGGFSPDFTDGGDNPGRQWLPLERLAAFNGENPNGNWTLIVEDTFPADGGIISSITMRIEAPSPGQRVVTGDTVAEFEGNSGLTTFTFTVQLDQANNTGSPITVEWDTFSPNLVSQTPAEPGVDYIPTSGSFTFPNGSPTTSFTVDVDVVGDTIPQRDLFFDLGLNVTSGNAYVASDGYGIILNDDSLPINTVIGSTGAGALHYYSFNKANINPTLETFPFGPGTTVDNAFHTSGEFFGDDYDTYYVVARNSGLGLGDPSFVVTNVLIAFDTLSFTDSRVGDITGLQTTREMVRMIAYDRDTEQMYMVTGNVDTDVFSLYTLNVGTGAATFVADIDFGGEFSWAAAAFFTTEGQLYLVDPYLNRAGGTSRLWLVDKATGVATQGPALVPQTFFNLRLFYGLYADATYDDLTNTAIVFGQRSDPFANPPAGIPTGIGNAVTTIDLETGQITQLGTNIATFGQGGTVINTLGIVSDLTADIPLITFGEPTVVEGPAGETTTATVEVFLQEDAGSSRVGDIVLNWTTRDGTAFAAPQPANPLGDYVPAVGTIVFPEGDSATRTVEITINGDDTAELNEYFYVDFALDPGSATALLTTATARVTIEDDDDLLQQVGFGTLGTTATITEMLSGATFGFFSQGVGLFRGGDFVGDDFSKFYSVNADNDTGYFVDSVSQVSFPVAALTGLPAGQIIWDVAYSYVDGQMYAITWGGGGATSVTVGTINIDTGAFTTLATYTMAELQAAGRPLPSQLLGGIAVHPTTNEVYITSLVPGFNGIELLRLRPFTNNIVTLVGQVVGPEVTSFPLVMNFDPQSEQLFASVRTVFEGSATTTTYEFNPSSGAGSLIGYHPVIGPRDSLGIRRLSDPTLPQVVVTNESVLEGDSGTTPMEFTVFLANGPNTTGANIVVDYATITNTATTATPGVDFVPTSGAVIIADGEEEATFTVDIIGDTVLEADEIFFVQISLNPASAPATVLSGIGIGTIIDDDPFGATRMGWTGANDEGIEAFARVNLDTGLGAGWSIHNPYIEGMGSVEAGDFVGTTGTNFTFATNRLVTGAGPARLATVDPTEGGGITLGPEITGLPAGFNIADMAWDAAGNRMLVLLLQTAIPRSNIVGTVDLSTGAFTQLATYDPVFIQENISPTYNLASGLAASPTGTIYLVTLESNFDGAGAVTEFLGHTIYDISSLTTNSLTFLSGINMAGVAPNLFFYGYSADFDPVSNNVIVAFTDFSTDTVAYYEVPPANPGATTFIGNNSGASDALGFAIFPAGTSVDDWSLIDF